MCLREEPRERYALGAEPRQERDDPVQRPGREFPLTLELPQRAVDLPVEVRRNCDRRLADGVRDREVGVVPG